MKKLLMFASMIAIGTVQAAPVAVNFESTSNTFDFKLSSCDKTNATTVVCKGSLYSKIDYPSFLNGNYFKIISPDGDVSRVSGVLIKGKNGFGSFEFAKDITYPMEITFENFPSNVARYFDFAGVRYENVQLSTVATPAGRVATPAPIRLSGTNYNVTLSDCQTVQGANFACKALFSPAK